MKTQITLKHIIAELIFLNIRSFLLLLLNETERTTPYKVQNPEKCLRIHYQRLVNQCLNLHLTSTTPLN